MKRYSFIYFVFFNLTAVAQLNLDIEGSFQLSEQIFSVKEAGLDFSADIPEDQSTIYLSITDLDELNKKNNPNNKWKVYMYFDGNPDNDFQVEVKRTGHGYKPNANGTPNIHDGEEYTVVQNTTTYFFRGKGEIVYIPVNIKINGASVKSGAEEYNSNITFTVVDDW